MFKKILIAEDIDSINIGIVAILKNLTNATIQHSKYGDDALLKIKKGLYDNEPYDLLISDLSFKQDHRHIKLATGDELVEAVKKEQPDIKTIVYSIEDRPFRIKSLFENLNINAYVSKGREGSLELSNAIKFIFNSDEKFVSPHLAHLLTDPTILEIDDIDIDLVRQLSLGMNQEEIAKFFKEQGKSSSSISSIEKRLNKLKIYFKAKNTIHLVGIAKDMGLI